MRTMSKSRTITKPDTIPFPHPGETILEDYLKPLGMTASGLARELGVSSARIYDIVNRRGGITTDTAFRLARFFDTTPRFWMNLQVAYDLRRAAEGIAPEIDRTIRPLKAA